MLRRNSTFFETPDTWVCKASEFQLVTSWYHTVDPFNCNVQTAEETDKPNHPSQGTARVGAPIYWGRGGVTLDFVFRFFCFGPEAFGWKEYIFDRRKRPWPPQSSSTMTHLIMAKTNAHPERSAALLAFSIWVTGFSSYGTVIMPSLESCLMESTKASTKKLKVLRNSYRYCPMAGSSG